MVDILADPKQDDGSNALRQAQTNGPARLSFGAKFVTPMRVLSDNIDPAQTGTDRRRRAQPRPPDHMGSPACVTWLPPSGRASRASPMPCDCCEPIAWCRSAGRGAWPTTASLTGMCACCWIPSGHRHQHPRTSRPRRCPHRRRLDPSGRHRSSATPMNPGCLFPMLSVPADDPDETRPVRPKRATDGLRRYGGRL